MKMYWVLAYYDYYPDVDNYKASFMTREEALEYIVNERNKGGSYDKYEVIDISDRLYERN